jgi:hypothetical protein
MRFGRLKGALLAVPVAAIVAVILALSAGSSPQPALAFPILARPATDASDVNLANDSLLKRYGADVTHARAISAAVGTAYAIPASDHGMCLTVPDPAAGYGASCATQTEIQRRGLVVGSVAKDPSEPSDLVVVVPTGATVVIQRDDGFTTTLPIDRGVVTTPFAHGERVVLRVNGQEQPLTPSVDVSKLKAFAACDKGARPVPIPAGTLPSDVAKLCNEHP